MDLYMQHLLSEYQGWQAAGGLQLLGAAEDHLQNPTLDSEQRQWLYLFAWRWEIAEAYLESGLS